MKTRLMVAILTLLAAAACSTAGISTYEIPIVIGRGSAPVAAVR
jgi:outer membrane protein assembly factor BamE (lipoprotein component of BamABCDE complex)